MSEANFMQALKSSAGGMQLLYVEDNAGLREKVMSLLEKFFDEVIVAGDGEEGLALFRKNRPGIVITDIRMPKLNGFELARRIRAIDPHAKVIVTSAYDEKEYLLAAIDTGIFSYLKKPFAVDDIVKVLSRAVQTLEKERNRDLFTGYMRDILNYQSNLLLLMHGEHAVFPNQAFLHFFRVDSLEEFFERYHDLGDLLERHKGFLFNLPARSWLDQAILNPDKLFHVKIKDPEGANHHFILKLHPIPDVKGRYILSLNDVTELNLLALFDEKAEEYDRALKDRKKLFSLFEALRQNSAKVKILNFYKGLTIANDAIVTDVNEDRVTLKTNFMQQKAVQLQRSMTITSEAFPMDVICPAVASVDFEAQSVSFTEAQFTQRSPSARKSVRVVPEEHHTVSLFYMERKYFGEAHIVDLSVSAVKLELDALPAGLEAEQEVVIDMVLPAAKMPLIINTKARIFRIDQSRYSFHIVCFMDLGADMVKQLTAYIAKRQMDLIREFKGMNIGK